jgi:hypothetical protein
MARCRNCTFAVHPGKLNEREKGIYWLTTVVLRWTIAGCYGSPREDVTDTWLCDPCSNEKSPEASLVVGGMSRCTRLSNTANASIDRTFHAFYALP